LPFPSYDRREEAMKEEEEREEAARGDSRSTEYTGGDWATFMCSRGVLNIKKGFEAGRGNRIGDQCYLSPEEKVRRLRR